MYVTNRSPTEALPMRKTPVEMWTGEIPDMARLKVFGSIAYAKELGYLKKLDQRSQKYIFVGYALNGYRLFSEEKQKIIVSRDVIFKNQLIEENKIERQTAKINLQEFEEDDETNKNNEIEYEDHQEDHQESQENVNIRNLGEGRQDGKRRVKIPTKFDDYVLLTYEEIIKSPEKDIWLKAIDEEKKSLKKNNTFELVDKKETNGNKILSSKWVFKIKSDGKYKARLVIRGFEQKYGIDYQETFSPVVNVNALKVLFAIAISKDYEIRTFDIKTAFLYGDLNEKVFMHIPEGYEQNENKVLQLRKSLYGLKQAPLQWNKRFTNYLKDCELTSLKTEHCIFKNKKGSLYLAIYVDDGILMYDKNNEEEVKNLIKKLKDEFEMVECKEPKEYLGIKIERNSEHLILMLVKLTILSQYLKNFK